MTAAHDLTETFAALGGEPSSVPDLIVTGIALHYGAPWDVGPATPWHLIGTDVTRQHLLGEVEDHFAVEISDDDREGLRTLADLIRLVERRAHA